MAETIDFVEAAILSSVKVVVATCDQDFEIVAQIDKLIL